MSKSSPPPDPADEEWESLLRHWQERQPAQPRPFFYSRVRARLAGEMLPERPPLPAWLRWPSYAAMLGILLLLSGDGAVLPTAKPANQPESYLRDQPAARYPR
ncbi:hypothetical protein E5K00_10905 [Hymenobacter aquaticus]|uniref:Uncharacterized protein n=1 Tax=Hymenobacter aquaticus TaxID=1867101 RepID=A0A4Z0Q6F3_9BACT|nr:hypothetical protein [Hymenobacter aquaticus]TGE25670.1 hypothetical protein E5K00_10905 [Hymenobacter aquaticus]